MKRRSTSERVFIEEIAQVAASLKKASKGLSLGSLIKLIRSQFGMSQAILAKRAGVPQSTISRLEREVKNPNLSTLHKILNALFCDLIIVPMLREPVDTIRRKQAKKQAEHRIRYLKGTMSLEKQHPDSRFIKELLKEEETQLLNNPQDLWEE